MHRSIDKLTIFPNYLLVDGDRFNPYIDNIGEIIPYSTIEDGDNKYISIASASILAKTYHDDYISEMCTKYPILSEEYGLDKNMGYGTKIHMDAVMEWGATQFHRKTFNPCKIAKTLTI